MRFHVLTLGCDKNTVDSERYVAELVAHGAQPAPRAEDADLVVVNTCGFIDAAKAESIEAIVQAARLKESGPCRMVAAVGCMVERHRAELVDSLPEVDLFLGTRDTDRLVQEVQERGLLKYAPPLVHPGTRLYTGDLPHVRYLKISEGCDHGCAFCAIPLMRGKHRSFAMDELVHEAQLLQLQGAREVNLVAQDLAHYGRDIRGGHGLPELISALLDGTDIPWFRLLYIYSAGLTPQMLELIAREPRIVRYLDIPMQHASDRVLARMRRPERRERQREKIRLIRDTVPDIAIRTTVITGFPGETDEDVRQLLDFLEEVQLDRVGVFTYSAQEGTRANEFPDDVPEAVKRERAERVMEVQRLVTSERYEARLGRTVRAMMDKVPAHGPAQARIDGQADDIDGVTWVTAAAEPAPGEPHGIPVSNGAGLPLQPGEIVDVTLTAVAEDYDFEATLMRRLEPAPTTHPPLRARALPVMPSAGAWGR